MVKSVFISVLTGQHEGIDEYFPFLDSDDRIEVSFCVLRAMFSGVNFNCSQFVERASSSMTIDGIFSRREDLRRASRHLVAVAPGSGVATQDHMNPATYLRIEGTGGTDRTRCSIKRHRFRRAHGLLAAVNAGGRWGGSGRWRAARWPVARAVAIPARNFLA